MLTPWLLRASASLMGAALRLPGISALSRAAVHRLFRRLDFMPFLAGDDLAGFTRRLLAEVDRKRRRGELSPDYLRGWVSALLAQALRSPARRRAALRRTGRRPPAFAILSPGAACNLRCAHCYAATGDIPGATLSFGEVDRAVSALERAGTGLAILSGGEPLLWRDRGRLLFDLVERHPGTLFIVYTNGTLVTEAVAGRFAELGNVLPLLSVEGLRAETEAVRGPGVYDAVHRAMGRLRAAGVLFGLSVTASPANAGTLSSPDFFRTLVDGAGASFVWILDLAPLGRAGEADTLSPAARDALQRALDGETARGRLIVSFLHTRLSPTGCFGAGRFDAFFYLDWDARVRRCVYRPEVLIEARGSLATPEAADRLIDACSRLPACPLAAEAAPSPATRPQGVSA